MIRKGEATVSGALPSEGDCQSRSQLSRSMLKRMMKRLGRVRARDLGHSQALAVAKLKGPWDRVTSELSQGGFAATTERPRGLQKGTEYVIRD